MDEYERGVEMLRAGAARACAPDSIASCNRWGWWFAGLVPARSTGTANELGAGALATKAWDAYKQKTLGTEGE